MNQVDDDDVCLNKSIALIEEKLNWGESKYWKNQKFIDLSEKISSASGISISVTTLKRLFGKAKTYKNYQKATKNALAIFLGHQNWEEFTRIYGGRLEVAPIADPLEHLNSSAAVNPPKGDKPPKKKIFYLILSLAIALVALYFVAYKNNDKNYSASFRCKNPKGTVPYTASFAYNLSKVDDSVFVNYDKFGESGLEYLPKNDTLVNHFYGLPDFYVVQVSTRDKELASSAVNVESGGWVRLLQFKDYFFLPRLDSSKSDILTFSQEEIKQYDVARNDKFWIEYRNTRDYQVNGDEFTLETRLKNESGWRASSCMDCEIELAGETSKAWIAFLQPGCSRYAKAGFGGRSFDGERHDLSSLTQMDLSIWRTVRIVAKNKTAMIFMDDKLLFEANYPDKLGNIRSLLFRFSGGGSIDYVKLFNGKNELVYKEDF